jgi:HSP20 family molecular chaperone IbpA
VGAVTKELGETHKGLARTQMNMLRLVPGVGGLPPPPVLKAVVQGDTGPRRPVRRAVVAAPKSRATVASKHGFPQAPLSSLRLDPPFASDIADAGDRLICRVEMPGVQSEDVEVVCFVDAILLHVTRRPQAAEPVRRSGIPRASRVLALPALVRPTTSKATLRDGLLVVEMPKVNPTGGPRSVIVRSRR